MIAAADAATTHAEICRFIVELLREKGSLPENLPIARYRYLDKGHIDSLSFIRFIFRIEERFALQFSESDLVDEKIRSVGGLAALIAEKIGRS